MDTNTLCGSQEYIVSNNIIPYTQHNLNNIKPINLSNIKTVNVIKSRNLSNIKPVNTIKPKNKPIHVNNIKHCIKIPDNYIQLYFNSGESDIVIKNIIKYAASLKEFPNYISSGYIRTKEASKFNGKNNYDVDFKLFYGIYKIDYSSENHIYINYIQDTKIIGTSDSAIKYEELKIYAIKKSILIEFMDLSRQYNITVNKNNMIICKILSGSSWTILNFINKRNPETLFLHFDIKDIFNDINDFFQSEQDYLDNGVPFKLNYLLYGIPGSGKTSLIYTIASHFDLDICFLTMSKEIDNNSFIRAITNLPINSILVIEDIDSLFANRESKCSISFSSILNVLDGILKKHKLITFLTTNYKENLDSALFRSGRIDKEIKFDYIKKKQITDMYNYFFKKQPENLQLLLNATNNTKLSCSDLHHWCFKYRKSINIIDHINDLIDNITKNNSSNQHCYI